MITGGRDHVPDGALSASSNIDGYGPAESRYSMIRDTVGWSPVPNDDSPWIMIDLDKVMMIYQAQIVGSLDGQSWVTSFMIGELMDDL